MSDDRCTNVTCDADATHEIQFAGVSGTYGYCEAHYRELKTIEATEADDA
jgi:hypothetical protein